MSPRTLEVTVLSANDLEKASFFSKMDLYAVVSLDGDCTSAKHETPIDRHGGTNPTWNSSVIFSIDELAAQQGRLTVVFRILRRRALGDRLVGVVHAPVMNLLRNADANAAAAGSGVGQSAQLVTYQVRKPSGMPKGVLHFSYKFGDAVNQSDESVSACPWPSGPVTVHPPSTPTMVPEQDPLPPPPLLEAVHHHLPTDIAVGDQPPAQSGYEHYGDGFANWGTHWSMRGIIYPIFL
ncbi:hypothetical protein Nepgr_030256 [Nepenthes gracilis]|uniref:C2 domain-containing protein n=1 Tax=Nepenthes gracilis TaxID=150966 RepID=A0AAD3TE95_NEPGR|nr:hypothetical protein Nepgr_030256 [Nepenthes gracilis]